MIRYTKRAWFKLSEKDKQLTKNWNEWWMANWGRFWTTLKKTNTTHDIIRFCAFTKYRGPGKKYKKRKFKDKDFRQRLWWKQDLIRLDKPGWWNEITGWDRIGIQRVLEVKGPIYYNWKWGPQPKLLTFSFPKYFILNAQQSTFNPYPLQQKIKTININVYRFQLTQNKLITWSTKNQFLKFSNKHFYRKTLLWNKLYAHLIYDFKLFNYLIINNVKGTLLLKSFLDSLMKVLGLKQLSYTPFFNFYNKNYFQLIIPKKLINYIFYFCNIKSNHSVFKSNLFNRTLLWKIGIRRLRFNSHYLGTIDFRITLLIQKFHYMSAYFYSIYYAQQFSRITSRKQQRWFIRDIKRFNQYLFYMKNQYYLYSLNFSTLTGIHVNIKGRATDMRHVFPRQHSLGSHHAKSKHITTYKTRYTAHHEHFTTRWGTTNIRTNYYYNPLYHNNYKTYQSYKIRHRLMWIQTLNYLFLITRKYPKHWILSKFIGALRETGWITVTTKQGFNVKYNFIFKRGHSRKDTRRDIFFTPKYQRFFDGTFVTGKFLRSMPYTRAYYKLQEQYDRWETTIIPFSPLPRYILKQELLPLLGKTVQRWLKLLRKKKWLYLRKLKFIRRYSRLRRKFRTGISRLSKFRRINWFRAGFYYAILGVAFEACAYDQAFFIYKRL